MKQNEDLNEQLRKQNVSLDDDNNLTWTEGAQGHPRQWPLIKKLYTTVIVIWLECYMTLLSSSGAAAAAAAEKEYHVSRELATFAFITVYLLGQTFGGIFCSPISEFFGRRTIYIIATGSFGIASVIVGVPHHIAGVFVGRFFQGVAAAIPATVAFGNFSDLFDAEHRIWVVYGYTLFGMAGLALGPIYSSYITMSLGWRWVFHISSIASGISAAVCLIIDESNPSQLLEDKAKAIKDATGEEMKIAEADQNHSDHPVQDFFKNHLYRPLMFLFTEPIVGLCAALCAIAFGLIYGLTEALTLVYTTPPFDNTFDDTSASLSFIAILIGELLNVFPRIYDAQLLKRERGRRKRIIPETKIRSFAVACPALAVGLWIFAWTIPQREPQVPWPVSMIGLICVGFAANDFSYVLFGYVTDSYGFHAASAVSAISMARTLTAAVFPLFITYMYKGLGNNIATTVWAAAATLFCFTPWLFLTYGEKLRGRSKWAVNGDDVLPDENQHLAGEKGQSDRNDSKEGHEGKQSEETAV